MLRPAAPTLRAPQGRVNGRQRRIPSHQLRHPKRIQLRMVPATRAVRVQLVDAGMVAQGVEHDGCQVGHGRSVAVRLAHRVSRDAKRSARPPDHFQMRLAPGLRGLLRRLGWNYPGSAQLGEYHAAHFGSRCDDAKDIRDKAAALEAYARQRNDVELERWVAEIKLRAMLRIGEISRELDVSKGGANPAATLPAGGKSKAAVLKSAGNGTRCRTSSAASAR